MKPNINFSLINIDKPEGPTSFSVSEFVKRNLGVSKTSHMGTLDPKVTGVLPITLGRACKLASLFITHDKTYIGVLHTHSPQSMQKIQKLIDKNFTGKIKQTPPHKSAVKRAERTRTVYEFKILEESKNKKDFLFLAKVEGGTYIRKLCSDLGELIGGAHMQTLRRTNAGIFDESKIYTLDEFEKAAKDYKLGKKEALEKMLVPAEDAIKLVVPNFEVNEDSLLNLYTGKPLKKEYFKKTPPKLENGKIFAIFSNEKFIGLYKKTNEKEIFARSEFVYN